MFIDSEAFGRLFTNRDASVDTVGRVSERDFMRGISYFLEDLSEYKYELSSGDRPLQAPITNPPLDMQATDPQVEPPRGRPSQTSSTALPTSASLSPSRNSDIDEKLETRRVPRFSRGSDSKTRENPDTSKDNIRRIFTQASQLLCQQAKATGCIFTDASSGLFSSYEEGVVSPPSSTHPAIVVDVDFESTEDEETDADEAKNDSTAGNEPNLPQVVFGDRLEEMADVLSISIADGEGDENQYDIIKRKNVKKLILRYPFGKCFYLNKGHVVSDQSLIFDEVVTGGGSRHSILNAPKGNRSHLLLPRELLEYLPDAKWLVFLPLFNYAQGQWFSAGFIWGNDFSMGDPDDALPYFKAFGSCMMSEVASMEVLNTNIAKSTFIASISHDLRSPLHGMLGSLEFLSETITSAYQTSLIGAIETCGKTLLDTIDHLLDYAKINNLNRASSHLGSPRGRKTWKDPRSVAEPLSTTFDLALLLEEVVEAVFAGQTFRRINLRYHDSVDDATEQIKAISMDDTTPTEEQIHAGSVKFSGKVFLILHIQKSVSWYLQGQTGGLRRVIMNVVGNAIKYCKKGYIDVSLKSKQITPSEVEIEFSVKDTGIGMSQTFLTNHLFKAFSQEDSFTPGTGLGLSITSQIVKNMSGRIKVDSEKGVGTHVNITIPMKAASTTGPFGGILDDGLKDLISYTAGKKVCILDPMIDPNNNNGKELSGLESSIATMCREWFNMTVIQSNTVDADPDTAIFIYAEPPPIEHLVRQHLDRKEMGSTGKEAALLIVCTNAFEAAALRAAGIKELVSLGRIIEVISQPVGVRKLGKVLHQCLLSVESSGRTNSGAGSPTRLADEIGWNSSSVVYDQTERRYRPSIEALKWKSEQPLIRITVHEQETPTRPLPVLSNSGLTGSMPAQHTRNRSRDNKHRPRVLLVDDNAINLKLLVTFMRKITLPYAEAMNGLEAVNKYKESGNEPFDFVLMDLQMPVMDGLEATRQIREFEQENAPNAPPSTIIAITGVGNEATREKAMKAGMSQFLTKPVRFKALQKLLLDEQTPPSG